jgi:hypothetical protein
LNVQKIAQKIGSVRDERKRSLMRGHEKNNIGNKKIETLLKVIDERIAI